MGMIIPCIFVFLSREIIIDVVLNIWLIVFCGVCSDMVTECLFISTCFFKEIRIFYLLRI